MPRTDSSAGRTYTDGEGNQYWSVTTILNQGIPKPALITWASAEASKSVIHHLAKPLEATRGLLEETLQEFIQPEKQKTQDNPFFGRLEKAVDAYNDRETPLGMIASGVKTHVEKGRKVFSNAHRQIRDEAADAGSEAHRAIELYILGEDVPELSERAQASFDNFLEFVKEYEPTWEASELTVYNKTHKYAGTLDFIADIPALGEGLTLCDIKTGKGVYPEVALQLAAYRFAEFAETANNNARVEMPETERAFVLHLRPDKWEVVPVKVEQEQLDMFRMAMQVAWFGRRGNGNTWIGG